MSLLNLFATCTASGNHFEFLRIDFFIIILIITSFTFTNGGTLHVITTISQP